MQSSGLVLKEQEEACFSTPSPSSFVNGLIFCHCGTSRGLTQSSVKPVCSGKEGRVRNTTFIPFCSGELLTRLVHLAELHCWMPGRLPLQWCCTGVKSAAVKLSDFWGLIGLNEPS